MGKARKVALAAVAAGMIGQSWLAGAHAADARSPGQGNPVDNLPRLDLAPSSSVTVDIKPKQQDPALQRLLAMRIKPARFQIAGVKAVPFELVAEEFSGMTNREVSVAELLQAADRVTGLYRRQGYPLSFAFVPAQSFKDRVVVINVVEGYVSTIKVTGNPGASEQRLREIAEQLKEDKPLTSKTFERVAAILGMQPGVKIEASVQPPVTTDGAAEMTLNVKRQPIAFGVGLDNGSSNLRGIFSVSSNALTPLGEQITVSALAPRGPDREEYYGVNYAQPIGRQGLLLSLSLSDYQGEPKNKSLAPLQFEERYRTESKHIGAKLSYPLILRNVENLTVSGGAYAAENSSRYTRSVNVEPRAVELRSDIRALSLEMAWTRLFGKNLMQAMVGIYQGIDAAGADRRNSDVDLDFLRIRGQFAQSVALPAGYGLVLSGNAQYSKDVLPLSEQISYGARSFGLAYPAGEIAGDKGWGVSVELNKSIGFDGAKYLSQVQPYALLDAAQVSSNAPRIRDGRIASFGIGVRVGDLKRYSLDVSVAKPIGDKPVNADDRDLRLNLSYSYQLD